MTTITLKPSRQQTLLTTIKNNIVVRRNIIICILSERLKTKLIFLILLPQPHTRPFILLFRN